MILYAFLLFIAAGAAIAFTKWRVALYWFLLVGLLEDPVRKLVPGVPGYLVLATVPVWGAAVVGMFATRSRYRIKRAFPQLIASMSLFVLSLVPAAVISLSYGPGSWQLTLLGGLTYASVVFSVALGYQFARDVREVRRFLAFYCLVGGALLSGSLIEYLGIPFPATGTAMLGFEWIRFIPGVIVRMVAGFFRSPDMMGWHASMVAMLSLTLATSGRRSKWWLLLATWGALITILCGRRKMIYMLPFFVLAEALLHWRFGKRIAVVSLILLVAVTVGGVAIVYHQAEIDDSFLMYYSYDPGDLYSQVERHGYDSLLITIQQWGFFGGGLGSASTGAHHLNIDRPSAWQESGPSRLLMELGVPGFLGAIFVAVMMAAIVWRIFARLPVRSAQFNLWIGLLAIVLANAGAFVVSGQVYGDPFLSSLIAMVLGLILSSARLESAQKAVPARTPAVEAPPLSLSTLEGQRSR